MNQAEAASEWFCTHEPVQSYLPKVLGNGYPLNEINVECNTCDAPIEKSNVRGRVSTPPDGTIEVQAVFYCPFCGKLSPLNYKIKPKDNFMEFEQSKKPLTLYRNQDNIAYFPARKVS